MFEKIKNPIKITKKEMEYMKSNKLLFHDSVFNKLQLPDSINYLYGNPKPINMNTHWVRFIDDKFESIYVQYRTDDYPIIPSLNKKSDVVKSILCKFNYKDNNFKFDSFYVEISNNKYDRNIINSLRFDENLKEMFKYVFYIKNNLYIHEKKIGDEVIATYDLVETDKNKKNFINLHKFYKPFPKYKEYLVKNKIIIDRTGDVFPFIRMRTDKTKGEFRDITYLSINGGLTLNPEKTQKI